MYMFPQLYDDGLQSWFDHDHEYDYARAYKLHPHHEYVVAEHDMGTRNANVVTTSSNQPRVDMHPTLGCSPNHWAKDALYYFGDQLVAQVRVKFTQDQNTPYVAGKERGYWDIDVFMPEVGSNFPHILATLNGLQQQAAAHAQTMRHLAQRDSIVVMQGNITLSYTHKGVDVRWDYHNKIFVGFNKWPAVAEAIVAGLMAGDEITRRHPTFTDGMWDDGVYSII